MSAGQSISSVARALWLNELTLAIDEAQRLAWSLGIVEGQSQALDLYVRLELARAEVEALRGRAPRPGAFDRPTGTSGGDEENWERSPEGAQ